MGICSSRNLITLDQQELKVRYSNRLNNMTSLTSEGSIHDDPESQRNTYSFFNAKFDEARTVGDLNELDPFQHDFKPIKILCEGGYGKLILAHCYASGSSRVIKVVNKRDYLGGKYGREYRILKELNHPNIIRYFGSYEFRYKVYLVMEYCEGNNLLTDIIKDGSLTENSARGYLREITEGLCYLHARAVIHRDLKPDNILVEQKSKSVKIVNFGLSEKLIKGGNKGVAKVRSVFYSAPEIDEGKCSEKSDIWSMGVILYLMLSGNVPYLGETSTELIKLKKKIEPEFKGYKWTRVSEDAKDFIRRCLKRKEKARMSALEALEHSWLRNKAKDHIIMDEKLVYQLYTYSNECRLVNNIKYFICAFNELQTKENDLVDLFKRLDVDKNGELSKEELISAYSKNKTVFKTLNIKRSQIEHLFQQIDLDCSGTIDFMEFVAAFKSYASGFTCANLQKSFDRLSNKDGFLDLESLSVSLGAKLPETEWLLMLEKYDSDGNGKIDFEEFVNIVSVKT